MFLKGKSTAARLEEIVDVEKPLAELPPILSAMLRKSIAKNAL